MQDKEHIENFFLPEDFLKSVDMTEIHATLEAMNECGIDRAPFNHFCITIPTLAMLDKLASQAGPYEDRIRKLMTRDRARDYIQLEYYDMDGVPLYDKEGHTGDVSIVELRHGAETIDIGLACEVLMERDKEEGRIMYNDLSGLTSNLIHVLVVALATKGTVKDRKPTKISKLAKLGIGKPKPPPKYAYTTTISIDKRLVHHEASSGTGLMRRPHLRRGHARDQRFGPNFSYVKKIFIEPVFVNSDKDFGAPFRDHYNVSLKPKVKLPEEVK